MVQDKAKHKVNEKSPERKEVLCFTSGQTLKYFRVLVWFIQLPRCFIIYLNHLHRTLELNLPSVVWLPFRGKELQISFPNPSGCTEHNMIPELAFESVMGDGSREQGEGVLVAILISYIHLYPRNMQTRGLSCRKNGIIWSGEQKTNKEFDNNFQILEIF